MPVPALGLVFIDQGYYDRKAFVSLVECVLSTLPTSNGTFFVISIGFLVEPASRCKLCKVFVDKLSVLHLYGAVTELSESGTGSPKRVLQR